MTDPILVTGVLDFDPVNHDAVVAAMIEMMAATEAEEGNVSYTFSADLADRGRFHLLEKWADDAAMDLHMATPHMAAFMGKMGELGATGASITKWDGATSSTLM